MGPGTARLPAENQRPEASDLTRPEASFAADIVQLRRTIGRGPRMNAGFTGRQAPLSLDGQNLDAEE